jgi:DNA repair protein RadC
MPAQTFNSEDAIIDAALKILESRIEYKPREAITSPESAQQYLKLRLAGRERETFAALYLDNRHRVIAYEEIFHGTIDGCSVHPREVVKLALQHNAAAVIFAHNHPSGIAEPSRADEQITQRLKEALTILDVRALDHLIIGDDVVSFAERGLM